MSALNCEDAMPSSPPSLLPPPPPHALTSSLSKRKYDVMESETSERQALVNISMHKLQAANFNRRTEQSLRRSVLIFNTLKHLENQAQVPVPPVCPPPPPVVKVEPPPPSPDHSICDLDLSWLDFELSPKLPSLSAEDLRHGLLPSNLEPLLPMSTSPSCHPKKDFDELDHVMEILVSM